MEILMENKSNEKEHCTYSDNVDDNINEIIEDLDNDFDDSLSNTEKKNRKIKPVSEDRRFLCHECEKSYLSQPALTNHIKSKHSGLKSTSNKRGRGRPRKNSNTDSVISEKNEERYKNFWLNTYRKKDSLDTISLNRASENVFIDLFINQNEKLQSSYKSRVEHPILKNLMIDKPTRELDVKTADIVMCEYLKDCISNSNLKYFSFILKFVLLYRDCVNKFKNVELENSREVLKENISADIQNYTEIYSADILPEIANEFSTDFLTSNNYFNMTEFEQKETIEIVQHFCYWLYENNYTPSKLINSDSVDF